MNDYFRSFSLLGLCVIAGTGSLPAAGPTYSAVYYLTDQTSGAVGIIEGSSGVFYSATGATMSIFSVSTLGTETTLATFEDPPYTLGSNPGVIAANGLLYSSVSEVKGVGSGNVFSVSPAPGSEQIYPPKGSRSDRCRAACLMARCLASRTISPTALKVSSRLTSAAR